MKIFLLGFILMAGCRVPQPLSRPADLPLPDRFGFDTDSTSIADKPWNVFFQDKSLQALIDTALQNNLDLRIALQNIGIASADYQETAGPLRPSVTGVASVATEKFGRYTLDGKSNLGTQVNSDFFVGFQSSWEIDLWKRLRNARKAAYLRLLASESGVHFVRTNLIAEVAKRYYELVSLDGKLKILERNIQLQESAVEIVSIQKEGGTATELAVQQFRAQLLNTMNLKVQIQRRITNIENEINLLARRFPQPIDRTDSLPPITILQDINTGIPSGMLHRRPDIRQAELDISASEADVQVARAAFFPTLTITPFAALNPYNLTKIFHPGAIGVGLAGGLTAPLFNRIAIKSNYRRANVLTRQAVYKYQNVVNQSFYEVANELNDLNNLQKMYTLKQEEATTLRNAIDISKDLYLAGYATYLEIILAQRNAVDVELEVVNTHYDIFREYINLYRSLGGGWK